MAEEPETPTPPPEKEKEATPDHDQVGYWKRQAEKAAKEAEKLRKAQMSDLERAQTERDEAKREAEQARNEAAQVRRRAAFESAAAKSGCVDTDAAFRLLDENIEDPAKAIEALKKSRPYLFGQRNLGSAGGVTGTDKPNPNQQINERIRRFAGF